MAQPFSVIIPTYNRQAELQECLDSIWRQDLLPREIIIVDDGRLPADFLSALQEEAAEAGVAWVYHNKDLHGQPRGSSSSRNIGIRLAKEKICFILDDDLKLESYFFSPIIAAWKDDPQLLGVGGVIINNRAKGSWEKRYNKIFGLKAELSWDITASGFQSWDDGISDQQTAFYVHGGVCAYDKGIVEKLGGFTVFGGGREALEDVDFCWRAKQAGYYFLIEPAARVFHDHSPNGREDDFSAGYKEGANRRSIFKKLGKNNFGGRFAFCRANTGWILRQLLRGKFKKSWGMLKGIL
jgi:GT2 family glycosyltransferase